METLLVNTDILCTARQIPDRRKEIIDQVLDMFGKNDERHRLFHNHEEDHLIRKYSNVHYRSHRGKLVIFGWGEAVDVLKKMVMNSDPDKHFIHINNSNMKVAKSSFVEADRYQYYRLKDWVAMNNETYNKWKHSYTMTERLKILNNAINGNLKTLASIFIPKDESQKVEGELFMIQEIKTQSVFGNNVIGCNVIFKTKYHLPEDFALGRNVSLGVGTYRKLRVNPED